MASQNEPITTTDVLNYAGELFYVGAKFGKSPTLSLAGLGRGTKTATGSEFPMGNFITGDAPAQDGVTEDASLEATTESTYAASQNTNYLQQFQKMYTWSYASQALQGTISGVSVIGMGSADVATITSQRTANLLQLAADYEYSALNGTGAAWTNAATAGKMGGIITAIEAGSETAAGGAALSKTFINTEVARMFNAGAEFGNMAVTGGAFQIQQLQELYGEAPRSATVGGFNLEYVIIPLMGRVWILPNAIVPADDLVFIDMNHYTPTFGIVPGKQQVVIEPLAQIGAGTREQIFFIASIDYDDVLFHGMISGLATS
jgi:hypothetical protein